MNINERGRMISKSFLKKISYLIATLGFLLCCAIPASADDLNADVSNSSAVLQGADGLTRSTIPVDYIGLHGKRLALQPGDVVVISNDDQRADIMNVHGEVVGSFTNPQLYDDQGKEINARFFLVDDILALTERGVP